MEDNRKRSRSVNFSPHEKEILYSIIFKYKNILENKKTDSSSCLEKNQTWIKIAEELNARAPNKCFRSADSLKKFYKNQKMDLRKIVAEEKQELIKTGGGPPFKYENVTGRDLLLSIVNKKTVFGLENKYDADAVNTIASTSDHTATMSLTVDENDILLEEDQEFEDISSVIGQKEVDMGTSEQNHSWAKYTPDKLKAPMSSSLKAKTYKSNNTPSSSRRSTATVRALTSSHLAEKYNQLIDKRLVIANATEQKLKMEMEMQQVESKARLELIRLQIEIEKQKLKKLLE